MQKTISILFFLALSCYATLSYGFETAARAAFMIDHATGTILLSKENDRPLPPASMSKLMTLNMLFEALRDGRVSMDTKFVTSAKAATMGGSKMFLRDGERVTVENLIQGIVVHSGNDACVVVAENLAGSEANFARLMTERAKTLGLTNSSFGNSTGWPHPAQRMSATDLVMLSQRLYVEFPEYYQYFNQETFTWDGIEQSNRNPLLGLGIGADGLKTGHTSEAGYGLVGSAQQGNRRIFFMITGLESSNARSAEAERLTNWAFRQFSSKKLFSANETVAEAAVWLGRNKTIGLMTDREISALIPYEFQDQTKVSVSYKGPIYAPIQKNDPIAKLIISIPNMEPTQYPLLAANDVPSGSLITRLKASAQILAQEILGN